MADEYKYTVRRPARPPEAWGAITRSMAIERWGRMRETTVEHFKFTPRTTAYCLLWALAVPCCIWSAIKWERRARERSAGKPERPLF